MFTAFIRRSSKCRIDGRVAAQRGAVYSATAGKLWLWIVKGVLPQRCLRKLKKCVCRVTDYVCVGEPLQHHSNHSVCVKMDKFFEEINVLQRIRALTELQRCQVTNICCMAVFPTMLYGWNVHIILTCFLRLAGAASANGMHWPKIAH